MADMQTERHKVGRLKNCLSVLLKFLFLVDKICSFIFVEENHFFGQGYLD